MVAKQKQKNVLTVLIFVQVLSLCQKGCWGKVPVDKNATVVSHDFCMKCLKQEQKELKTSLKDVHTYAQLKHGARASLPSNFTICSATMTSYGNAHLFFSLLGDNENQTLFAGMSFDGVRTKFFNQWSWKWMPFPVFSNQWVKSCMAVDINSGLLQ